MYAQLNTYTITIKKKAVQIILALIFNFAFSLPAFSQSDEGIVHPLEPIQIRNTKIDLFVYGGGSITKQRVRTANANAFTVHNDPTLYNTHLDFGLSADFFRFDLVRLCISLGYIHEKYSKNKKLTDNTGITAQWLTADLNLSSSYLSMGVNTALFLNSKTRNDDHFSYNGIYSSCFNPMTFSVYIGAIYRFSGLKLEARGGIFFPPQINPNKIAYYNFSKTSIERFYYEFRISFRLFSTARHLKSLTFV